MYYQQIVNATESKLVLIHNKPDTTENPVSYCLPDFTSEGLNFYREGDFFYKDGNNYIIDTTSYPIIDGEVHLPEGRQYYEFTGEATLVAGPGANLPKFYRPNTYYYVLNDNYVLDENEYNTDETYYILGTRYVMDVSGEATKYFKVGQLWNENVTTIPEGVTVKYAKETDKLEPVELEHFARSLNTIHGLILKVNQMLEYENEITRDTSTVQGCINLLNDIIDKFYELNPGDLMIVDEYGRLHGSSQTSAQGYGYTNMGKPSASQTVSADAEDQFIYWNIDTDKDEPLVTIKHVNHSVDDTETVADKNTQGPDDSTRGLNAGVGDTLKLYTPIVDNMGHVVGENKETVTLPYGFKTITTNGRNSNNNTTTIAPQSDIVADNTQDTLAINSGNEWVKVETNADNDIIAISHDVKNTTTSTSVQNLSSEADGAITFEVFKDTYDSTNHFTNKDTKTITMPNSYGKFSGDAGSTSEATATHDTFSLTGDNWIKTTVSKDNVAFAHIGPVDTTLRNPSNITPDYGATFIIEDWRFDSKGHKAGVETHTIQMPQQSIGGTGNVVTKADHNTTNTLTFTHEQLMNLKLSNSATNTVVAVSPLNKATSGDEAHGTHTQINSLDTLQEAFAKIPTMINEQIIDVVNGAPETFDTLKEIAT